MMAEHTDQKRKRGRPKGSKNNAAQKATVAKAQQKSAEARKARAAARKAELEKPRWKQLEDGDIHVKDLTDEECLRGEVANNDGSWEGRRHRLSIKHINRMEAESIRRARNDLLQLTPSAISAIEQRLEDADAPAQQLAAARLVLEYRIGKVPEVVHVGPETEYDRMVAQGFRILRGEEHVVVEGEVINEKEGEAS